MKTESIKEVISNISDVNMKAEVLRHLFLGGESYPSSVVEGFVKVGNNPNEFLTVYRHLLGIDLSKYIEEYGRRSYDKAISNCCVFYNYELGATIGWVWEGDCTLYLSIGVHSFISYDGKKDNCWKEI